MVHLEKELFKVKSRRIRRVKKWLRPLPRRATIHRYPVLKYFSEAARRRAYIWSFRTENAIPAIYIGCVLTLLPIYGIQLPLALLVALVFKANLPILAGLQMVTNPFTAFPIYFTLYQIGRNCISLVGIEALPLSRGDVTRLLGIFNSGEWGLEHRPRAHRIRPNLTRCIHYWHFLWCDSQLHLPDYRKTNRSKLCALCANASKNKRSARRFIVDQFPVNQFTVLV